MRFPEAVEYLLEWSGRARDSPIEPQRVKIALKLKPNIEARARANQSTADGDKYGEKPLSATLPEAVSPVATRKELADAVGMGERTMGKVMQIDEHDPAAVREALDKNELSINQCYNITKQVQEVPEEQREQAATQALVAHQVCFQLKVG